MTQKTPWMALQIILSVVVIVVQACLFHLLASRRGNKRGNNFEWRWRIIGFSLSMCHLLSGICMLITATIDQFMSKYFRAEGEMMVTELYILATSSICSLFHMITVMINDYRFVIHNNTVMKENIFYIVITWISTATCAIMLAFVDTPHQVLYVLSFIILITSVLILMGYIEISRRLIIHLQRSQEFGEEYAMENQEQSDSSVILHSSRECPKFLGVLLATSFIVFTTPYTLERIIWHQNDVISLMCILLNATAQGIIIIARIILK